MIHQINEVKYFGLFHLIIIIKLVTRNIQHIIKYKIRYDRR